MGDESYTVGGGAAVELVDLVVVLGDDKGLTDDEIDMIKSVGGSVSGGGPVLCASLGATSLLASHAIVLTHHYLDAIHACPSRLWEAPAQEVQLIARQTKRRSARRARRAGKEPNKAGEATNNGTAV